VPAPVLPATDSDKVMLPFEWIANEEIVPPWAFVSKAHLPFGETATQQAAMPPVGTLAEITEAPAELSRYEESVLFAASETIGWFRRSKAKPYGTGPDEAVVLAQPTRPIESTA